MVGDSEDEAGLLMKEILLIFLGAAGALIAFLFADRKSQSIEAGDSKKTIAALEKAAELMGRRAVAEAESEEAKSRVEEKLLIADPRERLEAIAEELKDL